MKKIKLAIVGATGLVGRTVLKVLEEYNLPIQEYTFLASSNDNSTYKQYNTYSNQHEETDTEDNEYQDPIMAGYFVGCTEKNIG